MSDLNEQWLIDSSAGHYRHRDELDVCEENSRSVAPVDERDKPTLERNGRQAKVQRAAGA
jgi:hypothetical protein